MDNETQLQKSMKVPDGMTVLNTKIVTWQTGEIKDMTPILLLDKSGSMNHEIQGKRKINTLADVIKGYPGFDGYLFSDDIVKMIRNIVPEPCGSTDMEKAFKYLFPLHPKKVILVSDGEPTSDEEMTLVAAKSLKCSIDCIYIGYENDIGYHFMKNLAEITNGKFIHASVKNNLHDELNSGIERLLLN